MQLPDRPHGPWMLIPGGGDGGGVGGAGWAPSPPQLTVTSAMAASPLKLVPRVYSNRKAFESIPTLAECHTSP
eukprot:5857514-Prymnesium_polylepis.1